MTGYPGLATGTLAVLISSGKVIAAAEGAALRAMIHGTDQKRSLTKSVEEMRNAERF